MPSLSLNEPARRYYTPRPLATMMGNDDFAVPDLPPLQPVSRAKGRLGLFADMVATQPTVLLLDFWMKWHKASGQVAVAVARAHGVWLHGC